tara:strand:+ start:395 stop:601 length:207 start_codon:yes stop_codon:yes gene_type:complete
MLQLKMKKDTKNYFLRVLNKSEKYFMVWHGNCYSSTPVNNFTGFESFSRREDSQQKKNLKINSSLVSC